MFLREFPATSGIWRPLEAMIHQDSPMDLGFSILSYGAFLKFFEEVWLEYMELSWVIGVPPSHHLNFCLGYSLINHPFLGYPHDYGNPTSSRLTSSSFWSSWITAGVAMEFTPHRHRHIFFQSLSKLFHAWQQISSTSISKTTTNTSHLAIISSLLHQLLLCPQLFGLS